MYLKFTKQGDDGMENLLFYLYADGDELQNVSEFNLPEHYNETYFYSTDEVTVYKLELY